MIDPVVIVRSVHLSATVLTAGTVAFRAWTLAPADNAPGFAALDRYLRWTIWGAMAVAILSGIVWLVLVASEILGDSMLDVCLHGGAWQVAADTRFGHVWGARLLSALALGVLMLGRTAPHVQVAAGAIFVALLAWIGHAGATDGIAGHIQLASDAAHLLAAAAWLGGLPAFALCLFIFRDQKSHSAAATVTTRFSRLGIVCVGTLVATGFINSWNLLSGPGDLIVTDYGRLLLIKIGLFAAMVAIAAVNRNRLTPRIGAPGVLLSLRRNTIVESILGLGVLLIVGALGAMPPAAHMQPASDAMPPMHGHFRF